VRHNVEFFPLEMGRSMGIEFCHYTIVIVLSSSSSWSFLTTMMMTMTRKVMMMSLFC